MSVDRIIHDGETLELGDIRLLVHEHPGHKRLERIFLDQLAQEQR